ncbi:ORF16 [Ictalurid herpesvirus 1]|nr:ORF16 [Ictalurid herpesvirus 1]
MATQGFLREQPKAVRRRGFTRGGGLRIGPAVVTESELAWVRAYYTDEALEWLAGLDNPLWKSGADVADLLPGDVLVSEQLFKEVLSCVGPAFFESFIPIREIDECILFGFSPLSSTGMATLKLSDLLYGGYAPDAPGIPMEVYAWEVAHKIGAAPQLFKWLLIEGEDGEQFASLSESGLRGSLRQYIGTVSSGCKTPMDLGLIVKNMHGLVTALGMLMDSNVYHGDLKIDNLIVTEPNGPYKLIDFEFAHPFEARMQPMIEAGELITWVMPGTPACNPPEHDEDVPCRDRRVKDLGVVWQLGLIMLETVVLDEALVRDENKGWKQSDFKRLVTKVMEENGSLTPHDPRLFEGYLELIGECLQGDVDVRMDMVTLMGGLARLVEKFGL